MDESPTLTPVVKKVVVPLPQEDAFELFTEKLATWWPLGTHSVAEERAVTCVFEGFIDGRIYEIDDQNNEHDWGAVLVWDPPRSVVFDWFPGRDRSTAQQVEVTFTASDGETEVRLEHRGWETLGELGAERRTSYDTGWDFTLGQLVAGAERQAAGQS
jgi:uncharacterized protein YndB with AHSA1/START domain